jgi:hypothetical protein
MLFNLDDVPATYYVVPHTHLDVCPWEGDGSFDRITDQALLAVYRERMRHVVYQPGEAVLFFQHIVHSIAPSTAAAKRLDRVRLCGAFRVTDADTTLFPEDAATAIADQGVPLIKSGQRPPMYAKMHQMRTIANPFTMRTGTTHTLRSWSEATFRPEVCVQRSAPDGTPYLLVQREMPSLRACGLPMFPEYTDLERAIIMTPSATAFHGLSTFSDF